MTTTAADARKTALAFLREHMPATDRLLLPNGLLETNVDWALKARAEMPWGASIPDDLFLNDVLPYAAANERRDDWRADFYRRFSKIVAGRTNLADAALAINKAIGDEVKVIYSTRRKRSDQSPYESMEQGLASCTGLSILYVDACRAVCIPARLAGVIWPHKPGNHTWAEVWTGDGWHYVGAFEPAPKLDDAWFTEEAKLAKAGDRLHAIYALSFKPTGLVMPCGWNPAVTNLHAVNVTARYAGPAGAWPEDRARVGVRVVDAKTGARVAARVVVRQDGREVAAGESRSERNDLNDLLTFPLPVWQEFEFEAALPGGRSARETFRVMREPAFQTLDLRL